MAFRGLRVGDDRFDVEVERLDRGHAVRIRSHASKAYQVRLRWDAPQGAPLSPLVGGKAMDEGELERFEHFGLQSVRTRAVPLRPGGALEFEL